MRGLGVNSVGVLRITVLFSFIERTSTEAAEQTPAQERGPRRRPEPRTITRGSRGARRSPTRAGGFVFAEPMAPAPLLSVPGRCRGHQRLVREAWQRAPLLHYGSQVNPVRLHGRSHQLVGPTIASCRQTSIGFSCAPSGTTPVSR